jgi:hypothetical protein
MTNITTIPMAMSPGSSKQTRELAERMLQLTADEPADLSECAVAALYVMTAYIAQDNNRAEILASTGDTVAALVKANLQEGARISSITGSPQ